MDVLIGWYRYLSGTFSSASALINEDDKDALVPATHNHLVRVQWAQGEASRPKSGLSFLLKNPKG